MSGLNQMGFCFVFSGMMSGIQNDGASYFSGWLSEAALVWAGSAGMQFVSSSAAWHVPPGLQETAFV